MRTSSHPGMEKVLRKSMNSSNVNLKNKTDILDVLWRHDSVFKAEIARMVNLSQPTVLRIIEDLKKKDIVNVTEIGVSSGGRPPVMLELNKDAYNIISLDIDEYRTEVLLTDLKLNIIDSRIRDNQSADTSLSIMTKAVEMVKSVIEDNRERIREIAGIGVCVPGLVDAKQGYVIYSNELKWSEVSARKFFCQHFDGYITVEEGSRLSPCMRKCLE